MDATWLKVIILVVLFLGTYAFALMPIYINRAATKTRNPVRKRQIERALSFMSCFAAGVFLATCLLDLFPDVQEKMNSSMANYRIAGTRYGDYPFGESIMVVGFFLVLIIEQVVLAVKERHVQEDEELHTTDIRSMQNGRPRHATYGTQTSIHENGETDSLLESSGRQYRTRSASITSAHSLRGISNRSFTDSGRQTELGEHSMHQDPSSHSPVRSLVMLAALSLHSVFEGLAVGLQKTQTQVLDIFGALILHKCIIAFSIGLNLVQSKLKFWSIVRSNAIFCLASPIGIGIGIAIDNFTASAIQDLVSGILQGLACGTFLYVTFFEVLPHEFNKPADRVLKLLFVVIGFAFVNGVLFLEMGTKHLDD